MFIYYPTHQYSFTLTDTINTLLAFTEKETVSDVLAKYNQFLNEHANLQVRLRLTPQIHQGQTTLQKPQTSIIHHTTLYVTSTLPTLEIETLTKAFNQTFYEQKSSLTQEIMWFTANLSKIIHDKPQSITELIKSYFAYLLIHHLFATKITTIYLGPFAIPPRNETRTPYEERLILLYKELLAQVNQKPLALGTTRFTHHSIEEHYEWLINILFLSSLKNTLFHNPSHVTLHGTKYYMTPFMSHYAPGLKSFHNPLLIPIYWGEDQQETNMIMLETNVDDTTGEDLGALYDALLHAGARDVTITPTIMKKNRPGWIIRVIVPQDHEQDITRLLFELTSTLGVRVLRAQRHVSNRSIETKTVHVLNKEFTVRIKYSSTHPLDYKIEHDDLLRIHKTVNLPLRVIRRLIDKEVIEELEHE